LVDNSAEATDCADLRASVSASSSVESGAMDELEACCCTLGRFASSKESESSSMAASWSAKDVVPTTGIIMPLISAESEKGFVKSGRTIV